MAALAGRLAVVTGASRGVGAAAARAVTAEGCRVTLAARSREGIGELARELAGRGGRAVAQPCDVQRWPEIEALAARVAPSSGAARPSWTTPGWAPPTRPCGDGARGDR